MLMPALAGGFVGTIVMMIMIRGAAELGLTRMDLPFLLGTIVSEDRRKAKALGYVFQLLLGMLFAVAYWRLFEIIGWSTWWMGALVGTLQALFMVTIFVNELLPVIHPRMATFDTGANRFALIEPPGFLMRNYGRNTFLVTLAAHIAYGAIVASLISV
jgi:hypothetical protein